ncbi:MAG: galactosyldiacylglycerol synthase [Xanthomonadaceae bacterium]|jgi:processive 1,2-diacylglycerol beta-glucosyltransferase|nr:galactosyldiacylglycerol synthase [Xanthomonadaceae bacterium]
MNTPVPVPAKRLLLLSVSAGAGHVRAAEALHAWAATIYPQVRIQHLDAMDYVPSGFREIYSTLYLKLVARYPTLWSLLYQSSDKAPPDAMAQKLRRMVERLNTRALRKAVTEFGPDAVICTHFLPAEILMHETERGRFDRPVWVQVTDFDLHGLWVMPHMAGYFAANEEVAFRMRRAGIEPSKIHVTGIPVMPAFGFAPERAQCAKELGLDPERFTILLMGGGAGLGELDATAERLLTIDPDMQVIALAGRNADLLEKLQTLAGKHSGRLSPQGFSDRVERLMACTDVVVTKPGGLTTSECLAMGLPMIVHSPIPGQEERNADYLLEQDAALKAMDDVGLEYRVWQLVHEPMLLQRIRDNAKRLGKPAAARGVLAVVLGKAIGHASA